MHTGAAAGTLDGSARQYYTEFGSIFLREPQSPKNNRKNNHTNPSRSQEHMLHWIARHGSVVGETVGVEVVGEMVGAIVGFEVVGTAVGLKMRIGHPIGLQAPFFCLFFSRPK